jgi:hypothetical protein
VIKNGDQVLLQLDRPHVAEPKGGRAGTPTYRIGWLPKDSPRRIGEYLATLHQLRDNSQLEGNPSLHRPQLAVKAYVDDKKGVK